MLRTEPSANWIGLNRATFGARPEDLDQVAAMGWEGWVNDQLNVPSGDDAITEQLLAEATLFIEYPDPDPLNDPDGEWSAVNEDRPFTGMNLGMRELYQLLENGNTTHPWDEVMRPVRETYCASYIRATSSAYQVREVMVDFWNNHFNVHAFDDGLVTVSAPHYDRTVIRPNVFGNFRQLVEGTAAHPAMLQYLDNAISEADQPNKNYARELLELHTLGEDAYLGKTAQAGSEEIGFTDQDVIQASRALSGWAISQYQYIGADETGDDQYAENTGEFLYNAQQHSSETGVFMG